MFFISQGLEASKFADVTPEALQGLQPLAMKNLPASTVQSLSAEQLFSIPYETANVIPSEATAVMSREQIAAINKVVNLNLADFNVDDIESEFGRSLEDDTTGNATLDGRAGGGGDKSTPSITPNKNGTTDGTDSDEEVVIEVVDGDSTDTKSNPENERDVGMPPETKSSSATTTTHIVSKFTIFYLSSILFFVFRL